MAKIPPGVGPRFPQVVVLFGATGDLARRKLLPGLPSSTPNGRFGCFSTADPIGINNLAASR